MTSIDEISTRLHAVNDRIEATGVDPAKVQIVAVTKRFDADVVANTFAAGINDVAENYAQEARAKHEQLTATGELKVRWHFVGQLQRNKVRSLVSFIDVWQSVDSQSLMDELAKRFPTSRLMIQVNISGEEGRGGCAWNEVPDLVSRGRSLGLGVAGLMGVAPIGEPDDARPGFRRLKAMADDLGLAEVSMGMSGDFDVAVEEGSTMLRLGTALFGERPPR
jgi:PLP dependent protein